MSASEALEVLDAETQAAVDVAFRASAARSSRGTLRPLDAKGYRSTQWLLAEITSLLAVGACDALRRGADSPFDATELLGAMRRIGKHIDRVGVHPATAPKRLDARVQGCVEAFIEGRAAHEFVGAVDAFVESVATASEEVR